MARLVRRRPAKPDCESECKPDCKHRRIIMVPPGGFFPPSMPELRGPVLERYRACVGNRLEDFPVKPVHSYKIEKATDIGAYSHRLSYDAESILWLLLYWAIQIQPEEGKKENQIPGDLWVALTSGDDQRDPRHLFVDSYSKIPTVCHPDYQPLDRLLAALFGQLSGYQELMALPPPPKDDRTKDEYLHEAFQRTILDFIGENIEKPFMLKQISPIRRHREKEVGVAQSVTMGTGTGTGVSKRSHEVMRLGSTDGGEGTENGARKKMNTGIQREKTVTNEMIGRAGLNTRAASKRYVARTFSHYVGADIPAGTHQISKHRTEVRYYCIQPRPML
jgi:hypothetical protein